MIALETRLRHLNAEELKRKFKEKQDKATKSQIKEKEHKLVSIAVQTPQYICMARG